MLAGRYDAAMPTITRPPLPEAIVAGGVIAIWGAGGGVSFAGGGVSVIFATEELDDFLPLEPPELPDGWPQAARLKIGGPPSTPPTPCALIQ